LTRWLPLSWDDVETDPIKIFNELRQPNWNIIRCPVCGKVAVAHSNFIKIIHVAVNHVAVYEVFLTGLTWKQAREIAGNSDVFGIVIKDQKSPKEWEKAIQMLDDVAGVDRSKL